MALNNDDKKPEEVKRAEQNGGQTFDPTENQLKPGDCVDCNGSGLKNQSQVCPTCAGSGKA